MGISREGTCLERPLVSDSVSLSVTDDDGSNDDDEQRIRRALANPKEQRALIAQLDVFVRAPIRIALRRWPNQTIAGMEEADLVNEIFSMLFAESGRDLLRYDKTRGSLKTYVSIYTRFRLRDIEKKELRRTTLFPNPEQLSEEAIDSIGQNHAAPDEVAIASQLAKLVRDCVAKKLTTVRSREWLRLLYDQGMTTDELEGMGYDRPTIFRWRSAIISAARECFDFIQGENGSSHRKS